MSNLKEQIIKMQSLMERMEHPQFYTTAMLNEEKMLQEAELANAGSFLEFLTKYKIHKGPFVNLGYLQIYPTDAAYPTDEYYNQLSDIRKGFDEIPNSQRGASRLDKFMDKMQNPEWNSPTGRKKRGEDIKAMGKKLYPYVLKLTNYTIHWQSYDKYKGMQADALKGINDVKNQMSDALKANLFGAGRAASNTGYYPIGNAADYDIMTFGSKADDGTYSPQRQEYYTDVDNPDSKVDYERTAIRNYLSDVQAQHPVYFGIDEDGNIDEVPKSLGEILHNTKTGGPIEEKLAQMSDPQEIALTKQYLDLSKKYNMANKTFLTHNVAYICGLVSDYSGNKQSVYWVNDNPLFLLEKSKTKYVLQGISNEQLKGVIGRFAKKESDELMAKANTNVEGQAMYANPDEM